MNWTKVKLLVGLIYKKNICNIFNYLLLIFRNGDPTLFGTFYLSLLKKRTIQEHLEHFDECIRILLALPHLLPLSKAEAVTTILSLLESARLELDSNSEESSQKALYLTCASLEAIMYLKPETCITKLAPPEKILPSLIKHVGASDNLFALRALDFYISLDELNLVQPFADDLKESLYHLLRSPYQKVRISFVILIFGVSFYNWIIKRRKELDKNLLYSLTIWTSICY